MSQSTSSSSSPSTNLKATTDVDMAFPPLTSTSKPSSSGSSDDFGLVWCIERCESAGEKAPDRLGGPLKTPQAWEPELPDFDFTASPGAEDWQISETADGRAVYSTVAVVGARVTVEFQKWDW